MLYFKILLRETEQLRPNVMLEKKNIKGIVKVKWERSRTMVSQNAVNGTQHPVAYISRKHTEQESLLRSTEKMLSCCLGPGWNSFFCMGVEFHYLDRSSRTPVTVSLKNANYFLQPWTWKLKNHQVTFQDMANMESSVASRLSKKEPSRSMLK